MVTKERFVIAVERRILKKVVRRMRRIVKRYEKDNAERLAVISLQDEYLSCFNEYLRKYHRERRIKESLSFIISLSL